MFCACPHKNCLVASLFSDAVSDCQMSRGGQLMTDALTRVGLAEPPIWLDIAPRDVLFLFTCPIYYIAVGFSSFLFSLLVLSKQC